MVDVQLQLSDQKLFCSYYEFCCFAVCGEKRKNGVKTLMEKSFFSVATMKVFSLCAAFY